MSSRMLSTTSSEHLASVVYTLVSFLPRLACKKVRKKFVSLPKAGALEVR